VVVIGLSGYASSGKDTVAQFLIEEHGFEKIAFADPIRNMLLAMNPIVHGVQLKELVDEYGWDLAKQRPEVRHYLQVLGYSARINIDPEVWVRAAFRKLNNEAYSKYVITDVRFRNEAEAIKHIKGHMWRVERPNESAVNDHVSEWELDTYTFDEVLGNDGTLEELKFLVTTLVNKNL
jgi:hypothetical protein